MLTLTNKEARNIILTSQGLADNSFGKKKEGALNAIEHLGYVQIDTISVVERAHHHTIWSRVNDYHRKYLDELVEDKKVFEYWSHAAAYLPMRDYRFSLMRKNLYATRKLGWYFNKRATKFIYDRIKAEGPLQSKDFEEKKKQGGWWNWKESKIALEQLYMEGKLMATSRKGFQKVYDLTERVLPAGINTTPPTEGEYAEYLIRKIVRANGIAAKSEMGYLRPYTKALVAKTLNELIEGKEIIPVKVKGIEKDVFYSTEANMENNLTQKANKQVKILSPFDNSVIQRNRLKNIFGYDYTIECYVPEPKRVYGYFCLPVLFGNDFIGRMDCKADRQNETLIVKSAYYEKGFKPTAKFKSEFEKEMKLFARFNGCVAIK
ncbi:MAG TPA: crosslink repair DNA glycosylase YcaQ family protein [Chitinophagales bacterium]|nr:crosslink repair DNA glycosylase YcaQ family protein [Chitinophagales bacterium]